jgi:phage shock protein E
MGWTIPPYGTARMARAIHGLPNPCRMTAKMAEKPVSNRLSKSCKMEQRLVFNGGSQCMSLIHLCGCLALSLVLTTGAEHKEIEFTKDSLETVKTNVEKGKAVLVDVRSVEEWKKGHLEGALFVPVDSLRKNVDEKKLAKTLPKSKILYTFCVVGMRAKAAAAKLEKFGYEVRALKPGYDELIKAGFKKAEDTKDSEKSAKQNEDTRQRNAG